MAKSLIYLTRDPTGETYTGLEPPRTRITVPTPTPRSREIRRMPDTVSTQ
jgi:hypothetical protein